MMTPEPDGGFYKDADVASFIRKFGSADKHDKPDRLNFRGRHVVGQHCSSPSLLDGVGCAHAFFFPFAGATIEVAQ